MFTIEPIAFHAALDERFGFIGYEQEPTPHQSKGRLVRFPGSSLAAVDLGVSRQHLHRVLTGERQSPTLLSRWNAWLKQHPEFAHLNRKNA